MATEPLHDAEQTLLFAGDVIVTSHGDAYRITEQAYATENLGRGIRLSFRRGAWVEVGGSPELFRGGTCVKVSSMSALPKVAPGERPQRVLAGYYTYRFNNGPAAELVKEQIASHRRHMARLRERHNAQQGESE